MTTEAIATRPRFARSPHELVAAETRPRAWTVVKILGLVALTAVGAALATALVAGIALFTLLSFH
jgi:hypothetical protein